MGARRSAPKAGTAVNVESGVALVVKKESAITWTVVVNVIPAGRALIVPKVECGNGYYGTGCQTPCGKGCKSGTCHHVDGRCSCTAGWRGGKCSTPCNSDKYGVNCRSQCSAGCKPGTCSPVDGKCAACNPGKKGPTCQNDCPRGNYGLNCSESCSPGCYYSSSYRPCNRVTGECVPRNGHRPKYCKDKWTHLDTKFKKCDKKECSKGCAEECDHTDGRCDRCKPGWTHSDASLPQCDSECGSGFYGAGCQTPCGVGCSRNTCHHVDGSCTCTAGWMEETCQTPCGHGFYGINCTIPCNEGCIPRHCNHINGKCNNKCKAGWKGRYCYQKCVNRKYGQRCAETCGDNCKTCHHITGSCESKCKVGWFGENCTGECPIGYYGAGCKLQCTEGCQPEECDSVDGSCTHCMPGWNGVNCINKCVPGTYGDNCIYNCSEGCSNNTCDRVSGRCQTTCLQGWQHQDSTSRCDKKCDNGTYGDGCTLLCSSHCLNQSCHHVIGNCLDGCLGGQSGVYCEIVEGPTSNTMYIVGIVIPLIVLLAIILLLVFFRGSLKRRLKSNKEIEHGEGIPMAKKRRRSEDIRNGGGRDVIDVYEPVYANHPDSDSTTSVSVTGLKDYVDKKKSKKSILLDEYAKLPQGLTAAHDISLTEHNSHKNRFRGIYPYNHSLVPLKTSKGKTGYINANFIDGPTRLKQYIATQGPLPHTVEDFWEMIWQHSVPVIVMLANIMEDGKSRCEPYWPHEASDDVMKFGNIQVTVSDECSLVDYTIRTLTLKKGQMTRSVKHVHYMVWPDKDVPADTISLVALRHKVRSFCDFNLGPMVVHCSAGVGRTGTLIALDYLMEQADTHNRVDIYGCVWTLRGYRTKMVQTDSQYVFLHGCLLDALCYTPYPTPANLYSNEYKQLKRKSGNEISPNLQIKFKKLQESPVPDNICHAAKDQRNIDKNRSKHILPGDLHRPFLMSHMAGGTDYINAVIIPSYERRSACILTQTPLKSTVVDFWRLIHDQNIRGVVLLDNYTEDDGDCGVFWPRERTRKFGPFTVTKGTLEEHTGFNTETYKYKTEKQEGTVVVFRCLFWPERDSLPESPSRLLSFFDFIRQWNSGTASLLVVCRDGCTRSGLFCVLAVVLERLLLEKEVAIHHAIRLIRLFRKQVISTQEQFEFCHDAVKVYIDSFQEYSNFT